MLLISVQYSSSFSNIVVIDLQIQHLYAILVRTGPFLFIFRETNKTIITDMCLSHSVQKNHK